MGLGDQTDNISRTSTPPESAAVSSLETTWAPSTGAYLTDGVALFRVADAHSNGLELLLELEDCRTLELVLFPARTVAGLGLRAVTPARSI